MGCVYRSLVNNKIVTGTEPALELVVWSVFVSSSIISQKMGVSEQVSGIQISENYSIYLIAALRVFTEFPSNLQPGEKTRQVLQYNQYHRECHFSAVTLTQLTFLGDFLAQFSSK